jgi:molecular chaperone DnaK
MSEKGIEITKRGTDSRIAISPHGVEIRSEGKPVSGTVAGGGYVYLVVDCSTSMEAGDKLIQAKKGAMNFANEARRNGYLTGLIKFDSSASHLCEPVREVSFLERQLKNIEADGSTNMAEAIHLAFQKLRNRSGLRVMVIATDGMPDSQEEALREAKQAKRARIDIITVGTDDADKDFLRKLASRTNLGVKVSREQFGKGISSAAKMLPQLGSGGKEE